MIATTLIYVAGLALFVGAGIALFALLEPGGRWLTPAAPAAGAALLICLAHPLGFLLPGALAMVLAVVIVVALLGVGVWRRPTPRRLGAALALSRGEAATLALGAAAGLLLLAPVFSIGFPTTIAAGIADGWARSVFAEWLIDTPLVDSTQHVGTDRPIGTYSGMPHELGAGFEYLVVAVSTLLGRRPFETALPVATLAAPIALGGWAWLHSLVSRRPPRVWQAAVLAIVTLSPLFVLPLGENYLTQCLSIALWPFAMAATYRFAERPGVGRAAVAALGLGAAVGVYPPLAPWIAVPAALLVVVMAPRRAAAPAALALLGLGLAVVVVAPIQLVRGVESVLLFSDHQESNPAFPLFQAEQDLQLVLGGASQYSLSAAGTGPAIWQLVGSVALMLGAAAVGAFALRAMRPAERRPLLTLIAGVLAVTLALYVKYKFGDDYGYGTYKGLISGGALLGGLLLLTLASAPARLGTWRGVAAGVCLAVWVPVTAQILQQQRDGNQGFREADRALIGAIERLPRDEVVLVDGAAENDFSFRLRMATGYVAAAFEDRRLEGLGSTFSYFTRGGEESWRPQRPWRYVAASDAPSAFSARRRTLWREAPFRLQEAPVIDVTPYRSPHGNLWGTPPAGSPPADQFAGPVEIVVANRGAQQAAAKLDLELRALRRGRTVVIGDGGGAARRQPLPARGGVTTSTTVTVPARGTARVTLDPGEPELDGEGRPTPLVALTRIGVR